MTRAYDNIGGPGTTDESNTLSTTEENKIPDVQIRALPLDPRDFDWE